MLAPVRHVLQEHLQHGPAKLVLEQLRRDGWQDPEDLVGVEGAVGGQGVDVRVEGDQVAESLQELDEPWPAVGIGCPVSLGEQAIDNAAECSPRR